MEFSVIPGRIQMERFILVEGFQKKGNTFRDISFFSLLPEFHTYKCQAPHGNTSEKQY